MSLLAAMLALWLAQSLAHLGSPLQGLKPGDLHDTFKEVHNGHPHEAIDIMAPRGTPVHAVVPGTIRKLFLSKAGGNTIYEFDEAGQYCYYYAHLDRYTDGLREGMHIMPGDIIGYVGSTGDADARAPHLHFAVFELGPGKEWWKGKAIDPYLSLVEALKDSR
ncbi:MAG TPA: M23 family metallopeptidase [Terriglobia bacterium]|jgi:murein DD-endopeptidase MepM/ murein hydrolase activator NlpD